jgi:hypothetical protein
MSNNFEYDAALKAALTILDAEVNAPALPRHEKLAAATFIILHAIKEAGQCQEGRRRQACLSYMDGSADAEIFFCN